MQQRLLRLRLLGYAGVQLNALLVPLLVFQLSSSVALAGLALVMEWLPKLGLYLAGGSIAQRIGRARAHLGLDLARLAALVGLGTCALGHGSVWVVAACAALYQCSNALSNILFETAVTRWWPTEQRALGHARMLKADQMGCLLALSAGLVLKQPALLAIVAIATQALAVWQVALTRKRVHPTSEAPEGEGRIATLGAQLRRDAKAAAQGPLLGFALGGALIGIPAALAFSAVAYLMDRAKPGAAASTEWLSLLLLARTLLSLVALQLMQALLRRGRAGSPLAQGGLVLMTVSALCLAAPLPLWALGVTLTVLGIAGNFYMPHLRHVRQELITNSVPDASRAGVTGILISVEAGAYLLAAGLLTELGAHLGLMTAVSAGLGAVGALGLMWRYAPARLMKRPAERPSR